MFLKDSYIFTFYPHQKFWTIR